MAAASYVWGLGLAYAVDSSGQVYVYYSDGLGSIRAVADITGTIVQTYRTDEFGVPSLTQGALDQPFQYTRDQRDSETGLVYLRARMYDASLGRFPTIDPFRGFRADPVSLNRYAYAYNRPTTLYDPSGLCVPPATPVCVAVGVTATGGGASAIAAGVAIAGTAAIGAVVAGSDQIGEWAAQRVVREGRQAEYRKLVCPGPETNKTEGRRLLRMASGSIQEGARCWRRGGRAKDSSGTEGDGLPTPWVGDLGQHRRGQKINALRELREGGPSSLPELLLYLREPESNVRWMAADAIMEVGGKEGARALLAHASDPATMVRYIVAEAMGRHRYTPGTSALLKMLATDTSDLVRVSAAEALGDIGVAPMEVTDALVRALDTDRAHLVRAYAAESLARLGFADTGRIIRRRLRSERSRRARASMFEALSRTGDAEAIGGLLALLAEAKTFGLRTAILNLLRGLVESNRDYAPVVRRAFEELVENNPRVAKEHRWFLEFAAQLPADQ